MDTLDRAIGNIDAQLLGVTDPGARAQLTQWRTEYMGLKKLTMNQIWQYLPPDCRSRILDTCRRHEEALNKAISNTIIVDFPTRSIFTRESARRMVDAEKIWLGTTPTMVFLGVSKRDPVVQNVILDEMNRELESMQNSTGRDGSSAADVPAADSGVSGVVNDTHSTSNVAVDIVDITDGTSDNTTMAEGKKRAAKRKRSDSSTIEPKRSAPSTSSAQIEA